MIKLFENNLLLETKRILQKNINDDSFFSILNNALEQILIEINQTPALRFFHERDYKFLLGFSEFERYKKYHSSLKKFKILQYPLITKFAFILIQFEKLLEALEPKSKEKLFNEFVNKWLKEPLFPFEAEIETFTLLKNLEFKEICKLDVLQEGYYDFGAIKKNTAFNIEVKTLDIISGHPIIKKAAVEFGSYIDQEFLEQNFKSSCIIEYHFHGRLVQGSKNPQDKIPDQLFKNFCEDIKNNSSNIKVRQIEDLDIKDDSYINMLTQESKELQSGLLFFKNIQNGTIHIIKLVSDQENTYLQQLDKQIVKALEKFTKYGEKRSSVIFLQLANLSQDFCLNQTIQTKLKEFLKKHLTKDFPVAIIIFTDLKLEFNSAESKFENNAFTYGIQNNLFFPYTHLFGNIFKQKLSEF